MGWKCPRCRHHVYANVSQCPYCDSGLCEVCGYYDTQQHHLSYQPEIVIQLCEEHHERSTTHRSGTLATIMRCSIGCGRR